MRWAPVEREGTARRYDEVKGGRLGRWARRCRNDYRIGKLSVEKIAALEALTGWEWDPLDASYQKYFDALRQFVEREGHSSPVNKYIEDFQGEKLNIGTWVSIRRRDYKRGKVSVEKIAALEALPGWEWDPLKRHIRSMLVR